MINEILSKAEDATGDIVPVAFEDLYRVLYKILAFDNSMLGWLLDDLKIYEFLRKLPYQLYMYVFIE